jgi:UDP-N-acetylmuramate dehydrogenase
MNMFPDLTPDLTRLMPDLRGRLQANFKLADITWFRVGGSAQLFFVPADEEDLSYFLSRLPESLPVNVLGLGSNMLVRDGGMAGVVIRLTRGFFTDIKVEPDYKIRAGAAVPDMKLAKSAAEASIAGLAFYRGIPGAIGGALRMNAGAHGGETKDILVEARALDRTGRLHILKNSDFGYTYRHSSAAEDLIFTQALFQGTSGDPSDILAEMERITAAREASQPIRERTGGSTFKNPPGHKSWQLIDAAGCRGLSIGDAQVSEMHCNFLINRGNASAAQIETLGETVRTRVLEQSGVQLEWEIKRVGVAG